MSQDWVPRDCVALIWPDGRVRLASKVDLQRKPEHFRQNGAKKYDGPQPRPDGTPPHAAPESESSLIVPSYLRAEARRAAAAAEQKAKEDQNVAGRDESDEAAGSPSQEG